MPSSKKQKKSQVVLKTGLKISKFILMKLLELGEGYVQSFTNPRGFVHEVYQKEIPPSQLRRTLKRLAAQGWIQESQKQGKKFIKLTKRGKLQALFQKMKVDGNTKKPATGWELVIFDIPEVGSRERRVLRDFLKAIDFEPLQKSVYISPYALSSEAIEYLRDSGMMKYIRFLHVDRLDYDSDLKKKFR